MIITFWKGVFVADTLDEKGALKRAGFEPHEPTICNLKREECKACKAKIGRRWWTNRIESATRLKEYCNPRALGVMRSHLELLRRSKATDADIQIPAPPGRIYLPYQKAGVAYCVQRKDTLIGDDMGLGKTVEALGFLNYVKPKNTIIVCPRTLIFNWRNEAEGWLTGFDYQIYEALKSTSPVPERDGLIVLVNYEKLVGDNALTRSIFAREWNVAIYDEAHYIKNPESSRSQAILGAKGLFNKSNRNLFLSGTPIENYPKEIWPIAAAICPAKFGNFVEFAKRYCAAHQEQRKMTTKDGREYIRTVWVTEGASNLAELQQRLRSSFLVRRLKVDVLKELPPKRRQLVVLPGGKVDWSRDPRFKKWQEVYDKQMAAADALIETSKTEEEYRQAALALEQVTGIAFTEMSEVRHMVAMAKLPACIDYIREILKSGSTKNLVIFAHHRDVIETLATELDGEGGVVVVTGSTPNSGPRSREWAVREFQEGRKKIFIGQTRAAGVGITLTAADTVVFVEQDWVPGVITQCEDRLCRIGQKKMVHVIHPVLGGTMEVNMVQKLIRKQDVIDKALDKMPEVRLKKRTG